MEQVSEILRSLHPEKELSQGGNTVGKEKQDLPVLTLLTALRWDQGEETASWRVDFRVTGM